MARLPRLAKAGLALGAAAFCLSAAACALYPPSRIAAPKMFGMTCPTQTLCVDDPSAVDEAAKLQAEAKAFVEAALTPMKSPQRMLFCKTQACSETFGTGRTAGLNLATFGAVIGARGWRQHIVRHEMIHHIQNEQFGRVQASSALPRWFIEGMAYTLSEHPKSPPPPFPELTAYRAKYEAWEAAGNTWRDRPK